MCDSTEFTRIPLPNGVKMSSTFLLGDLPVNRIGYRAMRLCGQPGNFGRFPDWEACKRLLRRALELGVNFIDTAYRSGWGTKENQEITLALRVRRTFFDSLLSRAVPSSWDREQYPSEAEWSRAVAQSRVRLQWDPDHNPSGAKLERRAVQLGL